MLLLTIAGIVLFVAGLVVLFVKRFESTPVTEIGPVRMGLGVTLLVIAMASFGFPYTPWYAKSTSAERSPNPVGTSPASNTQPPLVIQGTSMSPTTTESPTQMESVTLTSPSENASVSQKGFR